MRSRRGAMAFSSRASRTDGVPPDRISQCNLVRNVGTGTPGTLNVQWLLARPVLSCPALDPTVPTMSWSFVAGRPFPRPHGSDTISKA